MRFKKTLAVGAALTVAGGFGARQIWESDRLPAFLLDAASELPPEIPPNGESIICAASPNPCDIKNALGVVASGSHIQVDIDKVPEFTQKAIIDTEDRTFYSHNGVSGKGILRALGHNILSGLGDLATEHHLRMDKFLSQGGSTIDRQTAGKLYFTNGITLSSSDKLSRQYEEGRLALRMNQEYSKKEILEKYLNVAPFGRNAYGIESAAQAYFNKPANKLSEYESIIIAGMLTAPSTMDVAYQNYNNPSSQAGITREMKNLQNKFHHVVQTMVEADDLTPEKATALNAQMDKNFVVDTSVNAYSFDSKGNLVQRTAPKVPFVPFKPVLTNNFDNADRLDVHHFAEFARRQAAQILDVDPGQLPAGIKIITTLNLTDQKAMVNAVHGSDSVMNSSRLDIGGVSMTKDGAVVAMVGSKNYDDEPLNLAIGKLGGGSGRDAGSTNKLYAYTYAFENGWTLKANSKGKMPISTDKLMLPVKNGKTWTISTGQACGHLGEPIPCKISPRDAFAYSDNIVAGQIVNQYGMKPIADKMRALGLEGAGNHPSTVLGIGSFSPYDEAAGYAAIGLNEGRYTDKHVISEIIDNNGKTIWEYKAPEAKQIFSPEASSLSVEALKAVVSKGTAKDKMNLPNGVASVGGKTGTGDSRTDLWFDSVACDTKLGSRASSIWVGNPRRNEHITEFKGSSAIAEIAGNYLEQALTTGEPCDIAKTSTMPGN